MVAKLVGNPAFDLISRMSSGSNPSRATILEIMTDLIEMLLWESTIEAWEDDESLSNLFNSDN